MNWPAAGMGHIVVIDDSDAQPALTRCSQPLWLELKNDLPPEVEYEPCGTIWIAVDQEAMIAAISPQPCLPSRTIFSEAHACVQILLGLGNENLLGEEKLWNTNRRSWVGGGNHARSE
jgi:hypothetical protein